MTDDAADGAGLVAPAPQRVERLVNGREGEVIEFLSAHPLRTFVMSGFIRDNGLESPRNRGDFYACRDAAGRLAGVALIGHATLFETQSDDVVTTFARHARSLPPTHIIGGETRQVDLFWAGYKATDEPEPNVARSLLYVLRHPIEVPEPAPQLRRATLEDAEQVARVHAEIAYGESGVNPLEVDREGFMRRTAQRIERGRVWVCADGGLNFKADVVSETEEVIYLEGVYVAPSERGKGFGLRCLARLCGDLLRSTRSVAVLVNSENVPAVSLYRRAGFKLHSHYQLIFPQSGARV
ncbi:MAG TPA: GNAT family N-acetyltransferase [Pyrinomonadaceae bacterium]|jgi:ribosomal protein S18 acetylase RimI-like enzyme|nr:GNAT family N-acetyltransferase [Pyrinomonadaceae bacterium]